MHNYYKIFLGLISSLLLLSCDPIDMITVKNKRKINITIKLFCKNTRQLKMVPCVDESKIDLNLNCLTKTLKPDEQLILVSGKGINKEISNDDFHFERIEIESLSDTLMLNRSAFVYSLEKKFLFGKTFVIK